MGQCLELQSKLKEEVSLKKMWLRTDIETRYYQPALEIICNFFFLHFGKLELNPYKFVQFQSYENIRFLENSKREGPQNVQ